MTFQYRTKPFQHQKEHFETHANDLAWGLFWEQGCGKTKPTIDTIAHLYQQNKINGALILAPNGVHRNWINDQIPEHMPEEVLSQTTLLHYDPNRLNKKICAHGFSGTELQHYNSVLWKQGGLVIVALSYSGLMTDPGKEFTKKFLKNRRCILVADESHKIKAIKAKRTIRALAFSKHAPYKRILTGTPMEKPFDVYSQIKFLNSDYWAPHGLGSMGAFKQYFGIWLTREEQLAKKMGDAGRDILVGYKNLEQLKSMLAGITDRVTKAEKLDLPPKVYSKLYFEMTREQKSMYESLRDEYILFLENYGMFEADLAIVRMMKLQQITCGYIHVDGDEPIYRIGKTNPRLEASLEVLEQLTHKAIIWCRFKQDIAQFMDALGNKAVRYDGEVDGDQAEKNKNEFQRGDVQFFVANPRKGGEGIDLYAAKTAIIYSSYFDLILREQLEDRNHRIGMDGNSVNYIDVIAPGTVDMHIVKALRDKLDIKTQVTGDKLKEWL